MQLNAQGPWVVYVQGELWMDEATGRPWAFDFDDMAHQVARQVWGQRASIRVAPAAEVGRG